MATESIIEIQPIKVIHAKITIEGDGDLVLNKMNDPTIEALIDARKDKAKKMEKPDKWEQIITSMHWRDGKPTNFSEKGLKDALRHNAPCISAFGLKKSLGQAVVRGGIDKYSTKFDAGVNIVAPGGLIPITFADHYVDEKLMSPKRGAPVLARLNRFSGWKATFEVACIETVYGIDAVTNIVNMAGFGLGIGSGRTSGFGRYHIINVEGLDDENYNQKD